MTSGTVSAAGCAGAAVRERGPCGLPPCGTSAWSPAWGGGAASVSVSLGAVARERGCCGPLSCGATGLSSAGTWASGPAGVVSRIRAGCRSSSCGASGRPSAETGGSALRPVCAGAVARAPVGCPSLSGGATRRSAAGAPDGPRGSGGRDVASRSAARGPSGLVGVCVVFVIPVPPRCARAPCAPWRTHVMRSRGRWEGSWAGCHSNGVSGGVRGNGCPAAAVGSFARRVRPAMIGPSIVNPR